VAATTPQRRAAVPTAAMLGALPPALSAHAAAPSLGALVWTLPPAVVPVLAPPPAPPKPIATPRPVEPASDEPTPEPVDVRAKLLRSRSVPPFWIDRTYDTHRTRGIALPPLFLHRTPNPGHPERLLHLDLALTIGWGTPEGKRRWISPPALFFGSFSKHKTVWGTVPLLMGYRRVGEQFNFGQFPLVWWWGTKYTKNLLVVPFHYQQKTPKSSRAVSGILFWYGHKNTHDAVVDNDRGWFVGAPVFWRFRRGLRRFDFAFAYMGAENRIKGRKWFAITPLALWHESEFGNRTELWTPGWIQRRDRARGRRAWAVPPVMTFDVTDRDRRIFAATPLVWRTENALRGSRFTLAGPVGIYDDPQQRNLFVAPLWYQFRDKTTATTTRLLLPLGFSRQSPTRTGVWTLLGGGARTPKGYAAFVPPALLWLSKRDDGRAIHTLGGVLWHVHHPGAQGGPRRTVVLGPLGFFAKDHDRVRVAVLPPLALGGRKGNLRWWSITPLLWHARDREAGRRTLVAGPFYHHRTQQGLAGGLAPLLFWGTGDTYRYGVALPLLFADVVDVRQKSHLTLSPVFVRHSAPGQQTIGALGLFWDVTRGGGSERHTAFVPLFYRRKRGDERLLLTPVGGQLRHGDRHAMLWGPWVRRHTPTRDVWGVAPLVWIARETTPAGPIRSVSVLPLYLRRRAPGDALDMFSPLVWRREIGEASGQRPRRNLAVAPFYFRQRQPGGVDVDAGLGFFWSRDRTRRTHTIVAGPFFHRLSRTSLSTGFAPVAWWMDSEKRRRLIALPVIVHVANKQNREHTTVAVPFWFDRRRANGRRTWGAFPFAFGGRRLYNFTRFSLAPPGFVDVFRIQRNARFTGFAPLLWRYRKCGFLAADDPKCTYTLWGSAPLFVYGKDGQGRVTHGSLLYVYDRKPGRVRLYTPLFGINNEPGKVLGWYAGPVGVRTSNTWRRTMVFPLWFRRAHRLEKRSLTLAAPPLFIARRREDRRFFEAGLVVWQSRQPHKVSTAVLPPLFFHSHAWAQRRLTWVFPLVLRDDNWGQDQTWTVIGPLAYIQRRRGENLDVVQFPLVWHIERGENRGTFGAFLWWDIERKGKHVQVVPGLFTRAAGRRADVRVVGPGLAWWTRGRGATEGDFHWRVLLGLFGGGVEAGRRYVSIFGGRIDRGPGVAPPERKPRPKRTRKRRGERSDRAAKKPQR
ncbi:MAG: hypothetical protein K1X88_33045, partial [Nannocystaceae bacterium]|nr:hypothetical protein [Nannocystaceae bacterium]